MPDLRQQEEVRALCAAFVVGLRDVLRDKLRAVYVYGAVAFPETTDVGDVDFHVILAEAPTEAERASVLALHDRLARAFPPLGAELDGYYILADDARKRAQPRHVLLPGIVDDSWALHRAHILAGRCVVLHGPDPHTIYVAPAWAELEDALGGELRYVADHLAEYPPYCTLNLCRLMYSHETRDVVTSKAAAAAWAIERLPAWSPLVRAAERSYAHRDTAEDRAMLADGVSSLYDFALEFIERAKARSGRARPRP